ncbi:MAG: zinc ribbon domain-containing protein, partial [Planktothrix sp.]|uniref:zinc ribbon domain-containing protein n=1 Tax=Planktothrix sp. TaxID=3088171 RepID=UPI0038D4C11A
MLSYQAKQEGKIYLEIDRFFASSKTCNHSLNVVGNLPLEVRQWTCNHGGTKHHREINVAKSIRDEGLRVLSLGKARVRLLSRCQTHSLEDARNLLLRFLLHRKLRQKHSGS